MSNILIKRNDNRNLYNLVSARVITNLADSLFYMLVIWYVSEKSALLTSIAVLTFSLSEVVKIFFGPLIDRYSHKLILLLSATTQTIVMALLVIMILLGKSNIFVIIATVFISSVLGEVNYSVEESMIPTLVNKDKLVRANSIMEITYKISDSLFNGISGFLISAISFIVLIQLNLVLFILPIIFFKNLTVPIKRFVSSDSRDGAVVRGRYSLKQYKYELIDGLKFLWKKDIKLLILPLVFINFFIVMTTVSTPYLARRIEDSAIIFGSLYILKGVAGIVGAYFSNLLDKYFDTNKAISYSLIILGLAWISMIVLNKYDFCLFVFYFVTFIFHGASNIIFASLFQSIIPSNYLGRANTAIDTIITSIMPLGSLIAGFLLEKGVSLFIVILPFGVINLFVGIYYIYTKAFGGIKLDLNE